MRYTFLLLILTEDIPNCAVLERTGSFSLAPEQGSLFNS